MPAAARAAIVIAAIAATLTAFLLVELRTDDATASILTFILFVITVIVALAAVFSDHSGSER